jgi:FdrA protein
MATEVVESKLLKNSYRDSVELMRVAAEVERLPGVARAALMMGTPANRAVLADGGLLTGPAEGADPNDLIIAVAAQNPQAAASGVERATQLLAGGAAETAASMEESPRSTLADALVGLPGANLAIISTPGTYATAEALKALKRRMHVFLFSDNVSLAEEVELKKLAWSRGLLLMGPDCGTAILDGVPLGFANVVRRGRIGLIGASGTGLQEVSCLIDREGEGVSQAIGVGGRDLDERVGGLMMLAALDRLSRDPGTSVVVLLSKPPSPTVTERVLEAARSCPKPVVVNFLGGDLRQLRLPNLMPASTLEEAALLAVALVRQEPAARDSYRGTGDEQVLVARMEAARLAAGQRRVRGLYSGGTLAHEAKLVLEQLLGPEEAATHQILDLGDDEYTVGRPHPMIDPRPRAEQIVRAAHDPATAVVLLDVVLGYASHPDPAAALLPAIEKARHLAEAEGRHLVVVASVCGTRGDPQGLVRQEEALLAGGVVLAPSNARAARFAALMVLEAKQRREGRVDRASGMTAGISRETEDV